MTKLHDWNDSIRILSNCWTCFFYQDFFISCKKKSPILNDLPEFDEELQVEEEPWPSLVNKNRSIYYWKIFACL